MDKDLTESFLVNGHTVEVTYKAITGEGMGSIREQIRINDFYAAHLRAIAFGIAQLKFDSQFIIKKQPRRKGASISLGEAEGIPLEWDEDDNSLWDIILRNICQRETWLVNRDPFKVAFEEFADEEDEQRKDPTPLRAATSSDA